MINKDLPIGTVVLLRGGLKKVMITGYSSVSREDSEKVYDYNGCIFPEGLMENVFCLFDASQIEEVFYEGLRNDDYENYTEKRKSMLASGSSYGRTGYTESNNRTEKPKGRRARTAPKHPKSASEMHAKYDVKKMSGDGVDYGD
jgi:hypothetical protein